MLSTFFYLIVFPTILAFFLGYVAHGLKKMLSESDGGTGGDNSLDQSSEQLNQETQETAAA